MEAVRFGGAGERLEGCQVAKVVVNGQVVGGVVFVVGGGFEDGVEIEDGDAEVVEVTFVDFIQDALQVAAVEVVAIFGGAIRAELARIADGGVPGRVRVERGAVDGAGGAVVGKFADAVVVGGQAIAEAVGEDLVDDGLLHPCRHGEVGIVNGDLVAASIVIGVAHGSVAAAVELRVVIHVEILIGGGAAAIPIIVDFKEVVNNSRAAAHGHVRHPPVVGIRVGVECAIPGHVVVRFRVQAIIPGAHAGGGDVILGHAQAQGDDVVGGSGANRGAIIGVEAVVQHRVPLHAAIMPAAAAADDGEVAVAVLLPGCLPVGGVRAVGGVFIHARARRNCAHIFVIVAHVRVVGHGRVGDVGPGVAPGSYLSPVQGAGDAGSLAGHIGDAAFPDLDVHIEGIAGVDGVEGAAAGPHVADPAEGGVGGLNGEKCEEEGQKDKDSRMSPAAFPGQKMGKWVHDVSFLCSDMRFGIETLLADDHQHKHAAQQPLTRWIEGNYLEIGPISPEKIGPTRFSRYDCR